MSWGQKIFHSEVKIPIIFNIFLNLTQLFVAHNVYLGQFFSLCDSQIIYCTSALYFEILWVVPLLQKIWIFTLLLPSIINWYCFITFCITFFMIWPQTKCISFSNIDSKKIFIDGKKAVHFWKIHLDMEIH